MDETANGAFTDPTLLPVVFPGVVEHVESHLNPQPGDDRILDLDFCASASAIYHLEPIEDLTVREWDEDGKLKGLTLLLGRFARGAFAQRADRIPILMEKEDAPARALRGASRAPTSGARPGPPSTTSPRPTSSTPTSPTSSGSSSRIVHVASDDEIVVEGRRGAGYEALYVAFSRLRYSYQIEAALRRAFADAFGPVAFGTSVDCGAVSLLIFYFDSNQLEHPVDVDEARRLTEPLVTDWADRVAAALERGVRGARGPPPLPPLRHAGVAQRPLPRGDGPGAGAERPPQARGPGEPARGRRRGEDVGDRLRAARTRCARSTSPTS